ncbi:MAG: AAA family ATPase, partial [Promethearchaeota archaeon]
MIITKLKLINFKSHKDTVCEFNKGISLILGPNGAGKSSIFEAIDYAFFGVGGDDLISHNSAFMAVSIDFISRSKKYRIEKERKKKTTNIRLYTFNYGKTSTISSGFQNTKEDIEKILGYDSTIFQNAIYIRQGEIAKLITDKPGDRKSLISKLLGTDSLEKSWSKMTEVISVFDKECAELQGQVKEILTIEETIGKFKQQIKEVLERIKKSAFKLSILEKELNKLKKQKTVWDEKREKFQLINQQLKDE